VKPQNQTNNNGDPYLQSIKNIDDVFFNKSMAMFHDLNNLIIIFLDKGTIDKGTIDKGTTDNQASNKHNTTKRVYINHNIHNSSNINNNKKTRRNLFKDIL
jgi:hypothetical protein